MKQLTVNMRGDDVAEVLLYGVIGSDFWGDGITAKDLRDSIKGVKSKTINLRVNSPGGSVTEGSAMLSALDDWKKGSGRRIEVDVDGLSASAASIVMMGGNVVRVASNALVMIHDPYTMVVGNAAEMRRTAELLEKVKGQAIDAYMRRAKLSREELAAAMEAETWYTGKEAVEAGLADSATDAVNVAAFAGARDLLSKMKYKHSPELPSDAAAWAETERRKQIAAKLRTVRGD